MRTDTRRIRLPMDLFASIPKKSPSNRNNGKAEKPITTMAAANVVSFHVTIPVAAMTKAPKAMENMTPETGNRTPLLVLLMILLIVLIVACLEILFVVLSCVALGAVWTVLMDLCSGPVRWVLVCLALFCVTLIGRSMAAVFECREEPEAIQTKWGNQWPNHV